MELRGTQAWLGMRWWNLSWTASISSGSPAPCSSARSVRGRVDCSPGRSQQKRTEHFPMCGIAGCIGRNPPRTAGWLKQMQDSLRKRGPDDCGMWQSANVALVHTRLSIIDVAGSPQPMANRDASLVVTYNGEIYNYRNLRRQLQGRGHEFRTQGDTEVLLHLYRERGGAMLQELDGMFAFALYDARERKLLLARPGWHQVSVLLARCGVRRTGVCQRPWHADEEPRHASYPQSAGSRSIPALRLCSPSRQLAQRRTSSGARHWNGRTASCVRRATISGAISRVHGWPMPVRLRMSCAAAWLRLWPAIWKRPMCRWGAS